MPSRSAVRSSVACSALLADHDQVVSADRLVEALWPDGSAPEVRAGR